MNAVSPAAPLPSASPVAPPPAGGESSAEFSNALARAQQARQGARPPAPPTEHQPETRATAPGQARPAAATKGPDTQATGQRPEASVPEGSRTADAPQAAGTRADPDDGQAAEDAALPPWLETVLGRQAPALDPDHPALAGQDAAAGTLEAGTDPTLGDPAGTGPRASSAARDALDAAQTRFMQAGSGQAEPDTGSSASGDRAALVADAASWSASDAAAQTPGAPAGALSAAAPGASALPGPGATQPAAAQDAPTRQIHAPLHSPGFAPALGAQLNLMVRDGVTEARLNLNPAEMGPIAVQIRIDGQHARVEMTAEMAATRQALEQAMPALASALRDGGLTLTGGGVFEQARDTRQPGADGEPGRGGRGGPGTNADADPADTGRPAVAAAPRGVVDLYA